MKIIKFHSNFILQKKNGLKKYREINQLTYLRDTTLAAKQTQQVRWGMNKKTRTWPGGRIVICHLSTVIKQYQ